MAARLVVGLGNPGPRYERTRHNVGFEVVDALAARLGAVFRIEPGIAAIAEPATGRLLVKPLTWMNRSGEALEWCAARWPLAPEDVLVVVDDIHLPVGALRLRAKGSNGGHNGLRDIERSLGTQDYPRLRIGVGGGGVAGAEYRELVLGRFEAAEEQPVASASARAVEAAREFLEGRDLSRLAACYNGGPKASPSDDCFIEE
jgi:peptidyl-tRNA hydrolase, PTH1 family